MRVQSEKAVMFTPPPGIPLSIALCTLIATHRVGAAESESPDAAAAPVQAIWKAQAIDFHYQSFTTFYSCTTLEAKVRKILIAVGADKRTKVRARGCMSNHQITKLPYVQITTLSAAEATPEELAELDKTRSHRELIARVRGDSKQAEIAETQFPAHWQRVSLSRGKLGLEPGDCELVSEIKKKVLPKLAVKIVDDDVNCIPNQVSMTQPQLIVDVLAPLPSPDEAAKDAKK